MVTIILSDLSTTFPTKHSLSETLFPKSTYSKYFWSKEKKKKEKKAKREKSEETSIDLVFWLEFASYLVAAALPLPFFLSRGNSELWSSSDASALSCAFCETSWRMAAKWTEEKKLTTSKRGRKRVKREARRQEEETASFRAIAGARVAAVTSSACRRRDAFFPSGLQQPSGCCSQ